MSQLADFLENVKSDGQEIHPDEFDKARIEGHPVWFARDSKTRTVTLAIATSRNVITVYWREKLLSEKRLVPFRRLCSETETQRFLELTNTPPDKLVQLDGLKEYLSRSRKTSNIFRSTRTQRRF